MRKSFIHKPVSILLSVLMVLSLFAGMTFTANAASGGTCGEGLTWILDDNGLLTISGTGEMTNYNDSSDVSPFASDTAIKTVKIESGVTTIGAFAFHGCSGLTSVYIPDSVSTIEPNAFQDCSSLTSVIIPNGVTSISSSTFQGCSSLTSVYLPDSVDRILVNAFQGCSSLTSVYLPDSVNRIAPNAFQGCSSLTSIDIPNGVTTISNGVFQGCSGLTSVYIPDSVNSILANAFQGCSSLTSVIIPNGVTSIPSSTFQGCRSLTSVYLPDSVNMILANAFQGCGSLYTLVFPSGVRSVAYNAFSGCYSLTKVYCRGREEQWSNIAVAYGNSNLTDADKIYFNCEVTVMTPATCTSQGLITIKSADGSLFTVDIPERTHNWVWAVDTEADCNNAGVMHEKCTRCDATRSENTPIPATGNHSFAWVTDTAPTCGKDGVKHEECTVCHTKQNENTPISATGNHSFAWVTDTAPTCGKDGVKHEECTVCHATQSENTPIPATGNHTFVWMTDTEPTCGADGVKHEECSVCHAVQSENTPIPATGNHTFAWVTDTEPTCGADGVKHEECTVCHAVQNENTSIPATGNHTWEWITDTEPTCGADGVQHEECSVCHAVQSENTPIPATGNHDWKNEWSKDADMHWHTCTRCDEKNDEAAHTYGGVSYTWEQTRGAWKATAKRTCTVCEWVETETVTAAGTQSKAPTCTVNGETTYTATFTNTAFETQQKTVADIAALNHDWKTEWSKDGYNHWHDCTRCDEKNDEAAHTYGEVTYTWEQTRGAWKATAKHTCTVCGWEETETVGAPGRETKPAACTVNGETTYTATFSNSAFETKTKTIDDIAALDHAYDAVVTEPTCTEDGYTTHICSRCGDTYTDSETEKLGHAWGEWETVRPATPYETGEKKRTCSRCGAVETAEIEALILTSSVDGQSGSALTVTVPYAKRGAIATQLTAEEPVTYTSSNPKLLTVDENGNVTFVRLCVFCKSATITAVSADGTKTATCKVNVEVKWWQYIIWFFLGSLWF